MMYFVVPFTWLFGLIEKGLLLVPTSAVRDGKCKVGSIVPNKNFGLMMGITNGMSNFLFKKDLGHFWLGYIRMLGHLQLSAH